MHEVVGTVVSAGIGVIIGYASPFLLNRIRAKQGREPLPLPSSKLFALFLGVVMGVSFALMQLGT